MEILPQHYGVILSQIWTMELTIFAQIYGNNDSMLRQYFPNIMGQQQYFSQRLCDNTVPTLRDNAPTLSDIKPQNYGPKDSTLWDDNAPTLWDKRLNIMGQNTQHYGPKCPNIMGQKAEHYGTKSSNIKGR